MANGEFQQVSNILGAASAGLGGGGAGVQQFLQNQQRESREQQRFVEDQEDRQRQIRQQEDEKIKQADLERRKTVFTDSFQALQFAEQGDFASIVLLGQNRLRDSAQFPQADFSDTENLTKLAELAANGDAEAGKRLTKQLKVNVKLGQSVGVLGKPEAFTLSPGQGRFEGERQIAAVPAAPVPRGKLDDTQKEVVKQNVKRTADLSRTSSNRTLGLKKAREFLADFEGKGKDPTFTAQSGASRTAAGLLPGTFSQQSKFDERFDAFAEFAAREKLKASGETKPTDADVKGAKQAIFGVGRDESTNIKLLNDFINELSQQDNELNQLKEARKKGSLGDFFFQAQPQKIQVDF